MNDGNLKAGTAINPEPINCKYKYVVIPKNQTTSYVFLVHLNPPITGNDALYGIMRQNLETSPCNNKQDYFTRMIQAQLTLNCPLFPRLLFFNQQDRHTAKYSIEEYIAGPTLGQIIDSDYLYNYYFNDFQQKLIIIYGIVKAIKMVHESGFLHRDIKPDNIIITDSSHTGIPGILGTPVLIDFSVVSAKKGSIEYSENMGSFTSTGTIMYQSPEIRDFKGVVGPPTDVYSLGVTIASIIFQINYTQRDPFDINDGKTYDPTWTKLIAFCTYGDPLERIQIPDILTWLELGMCDINCDDVKSLSKCLAEKREKYYIQDFPIFTQYYRLVNSYQNDIINIEPTAIGEHEIDFKNDYTINGARKFTGFYKTICQSAHAFIPLSLFHLSRILFFGLGQPVNKKMSMILMSTASAIDPNIMFIGDNEYNNEKNAKSDQVDKPELLNILTKYI